MFAQEREIEYYETPDGRRPCEEWLDSLPDSRARAKIRARIDRVQLGNFGQCRRAGFGVSEIKVDYGPGYRLYFGLWDLKLVILLCGGDKSSQSKDIKTAQRYWADYRSRHEK
ncbi:MAG: type II toxin-antitoxin system RelE/ParE family toxin [Planctomycetes bacterium]|nr:type II toxin-antitoxin system RelE/ParE family toxin [Planctomycetota bacterium]